MMHASTILHDYYQLSFWCEVVNINSLYAYYIFIWWTCSMTCMHNVIYTPLVFMESKCQLLHLQLIYKWVHAIYFLYTHALSISLVLPILMPIIITWYINSPLANWLSLYVTKKIQTTGGVRSRNFTQHPYIPESTLHIEPTNHTNVHALYIYVTEQTDIHAIRSTIYDILIYYIAHS